MRALSIERNVNKFMKILVDADACPVKEIIVRVAKEFNVPVVMLIDTSHYINDGYSEIVIVEKGFNAVDIALINRVEQGDIVVSQDYGVASMALAKGAYAINQNGLYFTKDNIDRLLFERHIAHKVRRSGGKTSNPRRRTKKDDERFEIALRKLILYAKRPQ